MSNTFGRIEVIHFELRGSIRDVLDLLRLGGRDGITTGDAGESSSSSWVGGDGVIEGMAVERPGVLACPHDDFAVGTPAESS